MITSSALSSGNRARTRAATPATIGVAKLVPLTAPCCPRWSTTPIAVPVPRGSSETMFSPEAATPSQGPGMVKLDGAPLASIEPTEST
ncbi:Uncharacterised protein [Mycobacteroides abscessus subsp. abscessus]|nr:Uncharacterised protein [Mycobacteroides abscessus subsp. abscessus]